MAQLSVFFQDRLKDSFRWNINQGRLHSFRDTATTSSDRIRLLTVAVPWTYAGWAKRFQRRH